jgi:hypothetical protein
VDRQYLGGNLSDCAAGRVHSAIGADPADCPPALPREFTLTDGDATFTLRGIRGERTTTSGGLGDYKSLSGTGAPDHMFQNWWWYRTDSDTREFALSNLTAFDQPQANTVSLTYAESGLTYEITYTLSDCGDNQAVVVAQLTIANPTSTPIDAESVQLLGLRYGQVLGGTELS